MERRLLNQTFFKRILVGEDSQILGTTLTPVYAALSAWDDGLGQPKGQNGGQTAPQAAPGPERENPGRLLRGQGSHVEPMVDALEQRPNRHARVEALRQAIVESRSSKPARP